MTTEQGKAYGLLRAFLIYLSGSTAVWEDLLYAREFNADPQVTTLVFEGNETSEELDLLSRVNATVVLDKQDLPAVSRAFGKTRVAAPYSGLAWGEYWSDEDETSGVPAGLVVDVAFVDESGTPDVASTLRYIFFNGVLKMQRPSPAVYQSKHTMTLNMTFQRSSVDIAGTAMTGVPTGGAIFVRGEPSS